MYLIKEGKAEDLKDGRTTKDISELIEVTETYLSLIFNRKKKCSVSIALVLLSLRKQIPINRDTKKYLEEYFEGE